MGKNGRPVPGSRAEVLLDQLLTEVKGLRADLAREAGGVLSPGPAEVRNNTRRPEPVGQVVPRG